MNTEDLEDRNMVEPDRDTRPPFRKKRPDGELPPLPEKDEPHRSGSGKLSRFRRNILDGVPLTR